MKGVMLILTRGGVLKDKPYFPEAPCIEHCGRDHGIIVIKVFVTIGSHHHGCRHAPHMGVLANCLPLRNSSCITGKNEGLNYNLLRNSYWLSLNSYLNFTYYWWKWRETNIWWKLNGKKKQKNWEYFAMDTVVIVIFVSKIKKGSSGFYCMNCENWICGEKCKGYCDNCESHPQTWNRRSTSPSSIDSLLIW